mgnify:FL=1
MYTVNSQVMALSYEAEIIILVLLYHRRISQVSNYLL